MLLRKIKSHPNSDIGVTSRRRNFVNFHENTKVKQRRREI
jgi:hypothetical protein